MIFDGYKPHQVAGIEWCTRIVRGILADDPGLGKTATAIGTAINVGAERKVVVLPSSLALNWTREIKQWAEERAWFCEGKPHHPPRGVQWALCSYARLGKWTKALRDWCHNPFTVFDEFHELRGRDSQRSKAAMTFCTGISRILMLSGTPFVNHPHELYVPLKCMRRHDALGGSNYFLRHFCAAWWDGVKWNYGKPREPERLNRMLLASCMLRRTKEEVGGFTRKDPEWVYVQVERKAEQLAHIRKVQRSYGDEQRTALAAARWAAGVAKIPAVVARAKERIAAGDRILIFAHHKDVTEGIAQALGCPRLNGNVPPGARQGIVSRFQAGHHDALVISYSCGGVGLNCQRANVVMLAEYPWHPAAIEQGTDRAHRMGQTEDVTAEWLHAPGTIDDAVFGILTRKADRFGKIVNGTAFAGMVADAVRAMDVPTVV